MVTLRKKQPFINNDIKWEEINKTALLTIIGVAALFLISIRIMIGVV